MARSSRPARNPVEPGAPHRASTWREFLEQALGGDPVCGLILLAFVLAFAQAWSYNRLLTCIDYYQYWVAGVAAREPTTGDIYSDSERRRLGEAFWTRAEQTAAGKAHVPKQFQAAQSRRVL